MPEAIMAGMTKGKSADCKISIDEVEAAACMAAVYAYLQEDKVLVLPKTPQSAWLLAQRLEATGGLKRAYHQIAPLLRQSIWKACTWTMTFLALGLCLIALPVTAKTQSLSSYDETPVQAVDSEFNNSDGNYLPPQKASESQLLNNDHARTIRVAIKLDSTIFNLDTPDGAEVRDAQSGEPFLLLPTATTWTLKKQPAGLSFEGDANQTAAQLFQQNDKYQNVGYAPVAPGNELMSTKAASLPFDLVSGSVGYVVVPTNTDGLIGLNGRLYRGRLWIHAGQQRSGTLTVINLVDLEDYLLSVVPSEMPSNWPIEALEAQAIAARSYALANLGKHNKDGYDVKATIEDQVYSGIAAEAQSTNQAVAQTAAVVVKQQGKVIPAFFHSGGGGYTDFAENVWGKSLPFLQAVPDYDDASPRFAWFEHRTAQDLENTLRKDNKDIGQLLGILPISKTSSKRIGHVLVEGSERCKVLSSEDVRRIFRLPSTNFNVLPQGDSYVFAGRGWGHGLGLSQWGARSLAQHGYNAAQILTYYYKDVTLGYSD